MPPSCIRTVAAGPVLDAVISADPKRKARQSSGSEFPPNVPSWFEMTAARLASPVAPLRKLLSTSSPRWRVIISPRVCAPPVALRSGVSPPCALAVDRNDRVKIKAIMARSILFPQGLLGEKGDPSGPPFLFIYSGKQLSRLFGHRLYPSPKLQSRSPEIQPVHGRFQRQRPHHPPKAP